MLRRVLVGFVAVLGSFGCAGQPRQLEPRAAPPRIRPNIQVPATSPPPGYGRVILDATDGPMRIMARYQGFVPPQSEWHPGRTGDLCTTPCAVDIPVGRYKLFMSSDDPELQRGDSDDIVVTEGTTVYRRAPGSFQSPVFFSPVPFTMQLGGLLLMSASPIAFAQEDQVATGTVLLTGGLALVIIGTVIGYDDYRGTLQEGTSTVWRE